MAATMTHATIISMQEHLLANRAVAKAAGLRYVNDARPGLVRKRAGKSFRYLDAEGKTIRDADTLRRIKALVIPPAWTEVWICPLERGHLQATGRDVKGRKQYRYHARWRTVRDETKYDRMVAFGKALPQIRELTETHLALPGLPRLKVLATVVRLLESTCIRVGNEEYARTNRSFGLTTLRDQHVKIHGTQLRFQFRGKSGVRHCIALTDRRLARIVKRCQDLPGQELFQYLDKDGQQQCIGSADVNDYLRELTGADFTAKDFRTWTGTVLAASALREFKAFATQAEMKRNVLCAIEGVAARLGNTTTVCRKSYIHPAILELYAAGSLIERLEQHVEAAAHNELPNLRPEEAAVLAILQQRLILEVSAQWAA